MKIQKNLSYGQLYIEYGAEDLRIPTSRVEDFLRELGSLSQAQQDALKVGEEISVSGSFSLAQKYAG